MGIRVDLHDDWFGEKERQIVESGSMVVSGLRYQSGVAALRIVNDRGEIIVLPFHGQQIWRAAFDGRDLTMASYFDEPVNTQTYLENYGAFFIHCGVTAIGAPGPQDTHPLHGEIPNARFQKTHIIIDETEASISVVGTFQYTLAFAHHYLATATTTVKSGSTLIDISLEVQNMKNTPMDLMYLGHANFRPVDGGELRYMAPYTPQSVRVRQSIPAHVTPHPGYRDFLEQLAVDPTLHHKLEPGLDFDPEVVFSIDFEPDAQGWAHAVLQHPGGGGDYIRFRPEQAPNPVRWICRTPDKDAIAIVSPSTSGVEGYTAEKKAGRVVTVPAQGNWRIDMTMGALSKQEMDKQIGEIDSAMGR